MNPPTYDSNLDGNLRADAEVCMLLGKLIDSSQAVDVDWVEPAPELADCVASLDREQVLGLLLTVLRRWQSLTERNADRDDTARL